MNTELDFIELQEYLERSYPCDKKSAESWIIGKRYSTIKVFLWQPHNEDTLWETDIFKHKERYLDYSMDITKSEIENACLALKRTKDEAKELLTKGELKLLKHRNETWRRVYTSDEVYIYDGTKNFRQLFLPNS